MNTVIELVKEFVQAQTRIAAALETMAAAQGRILEAPAVLGSFVGTEVAASAPEQRTAFEKTLAEQTQPQATTAENPEGEPGKRNRPTKAVMEERRAAAVDAAKAAGLPLEGIETEFKTPHEKWTTKQCQAVFARAGAQDPTEAEAASEQEAEQTVTPPSEQPPAPASAPSAEPKAEPQAQGEPPFADWESAAMQSYLAVIRAAATGQPMTPEAAESLIQDLKADKKPTIEQLRAFVASACNALGFSKDRVKAITREHARTAGMTDEQAASLMLTDLSEFKRRSVLLAVAEELRAASSN